MPDAPVGADLASIAWPAAGGSVLYRARRVHAPGGGPEVDAMLVRDGAVLAVGPHTALDAIAGQEVDRVDLRPFTVFPGLIDAHCHLAQLGYLASAVDLSPASTPDIATLLHRLSGAGPDFGGWIVGRGYLEYGLRERRPPTRDELDAAVGAVPCVVYHASLHVCVVNSAGLAALGIDEHRKDGPRGAYGRDASGRLDGRLIEGPMFDVFAVGISSRLAVDGPSLVAAATGHLARLGVTSCVDANTTRDEFTALAAAARNDRLSVRVGCLCRYEDLDEILARALAKGAPPDRLAIVGAKVFADGGMSSRTAAVDPPYVFPEGEAGMLLLDDIALEAAARHCGSLGLGLGVHAQGERAIASAIAAYRNAAGDGPALRRIEHGGAFTPNLRIAATDLGLTVASQPAFLSALGDGFLEAFGPERAEELYPFKSFLEQGIELAFSSDAPVVSASPWLGVRDAALRTTATGRVIGGAHALSVEDALTAYTSSAARSGVPRADVGTLVVGAPADFIVLDRDPLECSPAELTGLRVLGTLVGNRLVGGFGGLASGLA